jgi:peptide/nickel transport system substrate-binding protein
MSINIIKRGFDMVFTSTRRALLVSSKLFFMATILAASFGAGAQTSATTLRWAAKGDVASLDISATPLNHTIGVLLNVYEGLVRRNELEEIQPGLATKWTFVTPTQVRFELRRGVTFHDGTPFDADDVVFSYSRINGPNSPLAYTLAGITEVKKIDDFTVDILLSSPNPILIKNLASMFILSKAWCEKHNSTKIQDFKNKESTYASLHTNGTGPYKVVEWKVDQKLTLTRNPNWWDKPAGNVTDVVITPIDSNATRVSALASGEVDFINDLPFPAIARVREEKSLKLQEGFEGRT